jgi:hypothetical protein
MLRKRLSIQFSSLVPDPDAGKLDALSERQRGASYENKINKNILFSIQY